MPASSPLPVARIELHDAQSTRYYLDPKSARVVGTYSDSRFVDRWLYHGLHSLNFPWLYRYRPLCDIVVALMMTGGTALAATRFDFAQHALSGLLNIAEGGGNSVIGTDIAG